MSAQRSAARESSRPAEWVRARFSVLVPLGAVVAVAIVCIIVAALTSAQRADDVALERERQLLIRAVGTHAQWSLSRLHTVARAPAAVGGDDIERVPLAIDHRLRSWLNSLRDHDLVLVANSSGEIVYSQPSDERDDPGL